MRPDRSVTTSPTARRLLPLTAGAGLLILSVVAAPVLAGATALAAASVTHGCRCC
jgi:hypothetical protein